MSNLSWLTGRALALSTAQLTRIKHLPIATGEDDMPLSQRRLVVVDVETSGLNTRRDHVLAIGAVVIEHGEVDFSQQFECTLRQQAHRPSASTLIHGLSPAALAAGRNPAEALLEFMEFVGHSPLLAFHAPFDQRMLARAFKRVLGYRLPHTFVDVAQLAPLLYPNAAAGASGLDDWCKVFGLCAEERHHASADALVTAEMTLMLLSKARAQGLTHLSQVQRAIAAHERRRLGLAF